MKGQEMVQDLFGSGQTSDILQIFIARVCLTC